MKVKISYKNGQTRTEIATNIHKSINGDVVIDLAPGKWIVVNHEEQAIIEISLQ
jgi:RNA-binding protein YhbY